jgi:hypothetical protein
MDAFVIVGLFALISGLLLVIACAVWWPVPSPAQPTSDTGSRDTETAPGLSPGWEPFSSSQPRVGVTGFEPATSSSRTKRATKLRHTP